MKNLILLLLCSISLQAQQSIQYNYDALNRITQVQYPNGTIVEYSYQPNGNRTTKSTQVNLPIELHSFNAEKGVTPMTVRTYWATASEQNGSHFEVEHSTNGLHFQKIGEVKANGNSTTTQKYEYIHSSPAIGNNYYRLKSIDNDASFKYSKQREVFFDDIWGNVSVYPNPTKGLTTIQYTDLTEELTITVFDMAGRLITTKLCPNNSSSYSIDLSSYPAGTYTLQLKTAQAVKTFKIEKY